MEWISVKDRLPENGVEVLIYYATDIIQGFIYNGIWKGSVRTTECMNDGYVNDRTICKQNDYFDFVTHWMPLPKPPSNE